VIAEFYIFAKRKGVVDKAVSPLLHFDALQKSILIEVPGATTGLYIANKNNAQQTANFTLEILGVEE
jgi:hypothetical protein